MRRAPAALAVVALALSAACGSTAQDRSTLADPGLQQQGDVLTTDGNGLGDPAATPGGATTVTGGGEAAAGGTGGAAAGGGGSGGSAGGGGTPSGGGTAGASGGTTGGGGAAPAAVTGPGITRTEIRLGIPFCNDCAGANAAIGGGGQDPGDTRRYYQAALDDVNARGGALGRKLVPVFHPISASENLDASSQAACERWTSDQKVAAMFHRGEVIYECAKKAGVLAANTVGEAGTGPLFARYPNLFAPAVIRLEGLYAVTVNAMVKAGWHRPSGRWQTGRIGLITWQNQQYEYAMKNGYLKAMHAAGLKETDVRYVAVPQNANSIADASAAISSAVLAFQQKGIDHVFIGDGPAGIFGGVGLTLLFLQNAKSQGYFPRYGFNSNNGPDFAQHPKDQLVGMIAIDSLDEQKSKDEGIPVHAERERCFSIMAKKGLPVGDDQTRNVAVLACETAFFAQAVFKRAGGSTLDRAIPAAEGLGTSYRSVVTYGTRFGPGRHDGVYLFRNLEFDAGCSCLKYTSKPYEP